MPVYKEEDIKKVVAETRSLQKASEVLKISKNTLYQLYRKREWLMPPSDAKTGKWDLCLAFEMRKQGWTYREIGERLGVDHGTVRNKMREQGIACPRGIPSKVREKHELRKQGLTLTEIANKYGVTRQAIQHELKYWYGISSKGMKNNGL